MRRWRRKSAELKTEADTEPRVTVEGATEAIRGTESDEISYQHCAGFEEGKTKAIDAVIETAQDEASRGGGRSRSRKA
jgi:hypothetical protein